MKSTDKGIFLHRISYSDSSLITSFLTKESGLRKFIFKGGKKKAHQLFPLSISELSYYGRNDSELLNLTQVEPSHPLTFQFDPVKGTIAFFVAEVIQKCTHENDPDEGFYSFIESAVLELESTNQLSLYPIWFLLELSEQLGIKPLIEGGEHRYFNLDGGQFQLSSSVDQRTVNGPGVEIIKRMLLNQEESETEKQARQEAMKVLLQYYSIHIPRFGELNSFEIIKEVLYG